jgi:metallo-beta-lactamase family protein
MPSAPELGLSFLGAVGTVTGSRFVLRHQRTRWMVDCGLFQGYKHLRERNWRPLSVRPDQLQAVVLTHAHLDHSGWLPVLCRDGFKGRILATPATRDLCRHLLPDSGFIQEKDAEFANRHGTSRHQPARPLYTMADAEAVMPFFRTVDFGQGYQLKGKLEVLFRRAGHIPGAATVELNVAGRRIVFSGDLGHADSATMPPPEPVPAADYLVLESTYGNRRRNGDDPETAIAEVVRRTVERGGSIIIPAFAVGRTQLLLHHLARLIDTQRIPTVPVYLDSPLAINATEVFERHPDDHRLSHEQARRACALPTYVREPEASKALDRDPMPKIIIAGSGMATGGRVLHHLKTYLGDRRHTILFAGYQAPGTRGEALVNGANEVKIHGQYWPVRAEVDNLEMLSAHADAGEIIDWLRHFERPPKMTWLVHGQPEAADALRLRIEETLGWSCAVPEAEQEYALP